MNGPVLHPSRLESPSNWHEPYPASGGDFGALPAPPGYSRQVDAEGGIELGYRHLPFLAALVAALLFASLIYFRSGSEGYRLVFWLWFFPGLTVTSLWCWFGHFAATLEAERLTTRQGLFHWTRIGSIARNEILEVAQVGRPLDQETYWRLVIRTGEGTVVLRAGSDRLGTWWIGRQIAHWAGVPLLARED